MAAVRLAIADCLRPILPTAVGALTAPAAMHNPCMPHRLDLKHTQPLFDVATTRRVEQAAMASLPDSS